MTTYKPARSSRSSNEGLLDETPINLATIPEELNFGVVCEGFVFTLQLAVHNKGVKPIFVRAHCKSELGNHIFLLCIYLLLSIFISLYMITI